MAETALQIPTTYIPDPASGRPVSSGSVYIGAADTDPETLANRISVVIIQENGARVTIAPSAQPLTTLAGGVIEYQGSPVKVLVDGVHSLKILDSNQGQKYYVPRNNETATTQANEGVAPVNGSFEFDTQTTGQPDNWAVVPGTNGTIANDTDSAHGLKSLKFTGTDATGGGTATSDKFDVLAGGNVGVRYNYKSTAADTLNKIDINWYNSADALISTSSILNEGAANPTTYTSAVNSVTAPATAVRAELVLTGVDGAGTTVIGSTYFDGIDVQSGSAAVSFDGAETLNNKKVNGGTITTNAIVNTNSGTSIDLSTAIPDWVNVITITLKEMGNSTTGTLNSPLIQVGDGSYVTSGYYGATLAIDATPVAAANTPTDGIALATPLWTSGFEIDGELTIRRHGTSNSWVAKLVAITSNGAGGAFTVKMGAAYITLSGLLDRDWETVVKVTQKPAGQVIDDSPIGDEIESESDEDAMDRFMGEK